MNKKCFGIVCLIVCNLALWVSAREFYVSPSGLDANPGTMEKPFATLSRAQTAIRNLKKENSLSITVYLRKGTYYLSEPMIFTPEDSGTEDTPVIYSAYHNEDVRISGGRKRKLNWKPYKDGILQAEIQDDALTFDQLFVDGKRQQLARWPNSNLRDGLDSGYAKGLKPQKGDVKFTWEPRGESYDKFVFDPKQFPSRKWTATKDAVIHIFQAHNWGNMQWQIRAIDTDKHSIVLGEGGWQMGTLWYGTRANFVSPHSRFYIENIFEELDAPGEWYYLRPKRLLFFMPPEGLDLPAAKIETAGIKQLIVFNGTADNPVHHISIRGIRFTHTARIFLEPYETRLRGDWAIARLGAVQFNGTEDCTIENCYFDAVGGNGVFLSDFNRRIQILDSRFGAIGESAICIVGNDDAVRNLNIHKVRYASHDGIDTTPGPRTRNYPAECRIHNNLIHDIGIFGKQTAGVYLSAAEKITISHNTIYRTPRAGICINDGCWGGHVIEYNDIFQTVRETGDHGPFNSWGRDRYWQSYHREGKPCDTSRSRQYSRLDNHLPTLIQNNRFVHETSNHSWGIDLDDGSTNYVLRNNLCLGCSVKLREGFYRTVENNIFITPFPPAKQCCFKNSNDIIRNNVLVDISGARGWVDFCDPPIEMDYNLYFNFKDQKPIFRCRSKQMSKGFQAVMKLDEWQGQGLDAHSVYADPLFRSPENGDFSVTSASPALTLGFKNFPMYNFGARKTEYRDIISKVKRKCRLIHNRLE